MWLSTDSSTVVEVSLLTRSLDVDFNGLTGVVDVSLLTRTLDVGFNVLTGVVDVALLTRTLDVDFNSLNYRGGRLFIDSGARCGLLQIQLQWWMYPYSLGRWMWMLTA
jgi:hypothetical protein